MRDESRFEEVFKNGKKLKINSGEIIYNSGGSNSQYYQIVCWNPSCRVEYALLDRNINILKRETLKFEDIEINYEQKTIKTPHFQYNQ